MQPYTRPIHLHASATARASGGKCTHPPWASLRLQYGKQVGSYHHLKYITYSVVRHSGGGISGLTLAIAFHRYAPRNASIDIDIYEGDPEVRTAGAGITVWPRTWAVMRQLGLYDDLARVAVQSGAGSGDDSSEHRESRALKYCYGDLLELCYNTNVGPAFVARKANQPSEGHTFARVLAPSEHYILLLAVGDLS